MEAAMNRPAVSGKNSGHGSQDLSTLSFKKIKQWLYFRCFCSTAKICSTRRRDLASEGMLLTAPIKTKTQVDETKIERATQGPDRLIHQGNIPATSSKRNTTYMCIQKHFMAYGRKPVIWRTCGTDQIRETWSECSAPGNFQFMGGRAENCGHRPP
ncbi:hypothetical protein [Polaromonas sp.]|jgi:hypothetical protein|uniref:hypothetical protein n=1 Tax=Polaromonas sp. TaxID=1869339 RepID=UPI001E0EDA49|nr:hypothetical protein [Polaromonas sp.]MBT9476470.1 hypothetical protein [Polaromonas sp.]